MRPSRAFFLAMLALLCAGQVRGATTDAAHPVAVPVAAPPQLAAKPAKCTTLVDDLPEAGGIAVKPTGQAFFVIDEAAAAIEMIDPSEPGRRQRAIAPFPAGERPLAIACIDSITAALVTRSGREWTLKTYRLGAPGATVDPSAVLQSIPLGESTAEVPAATVRLAVSPSRNWLVIGGLPSPMPAVLRGAIAGARVGGVSTRNCPDPDAPEESDPDESAESGAKADREAVPRSRLPFAVAISPSEELVLFRAAAGSKTSVLSMYSTVGTQRLLMLDGGLPDVRAAAYTRDALWVLAGDPAVGNTPEGLWRLDATIVDRRQAVRPVCVARLESPVALASLPGERLLVVHGQGKRIISLIEPDEPGR